MDRILLRIISYPKPSMSGVFFSCHRQCRISMITRVIVKYTCAPVQKNIGKSFFRHSIEFFLPGKYLHLVILITAEQCALRCLITNAKHLSALFLKQLSSCNKYYQQCAANYCCPEACHIIIACSRTSRITIAARFRIRIVIRSFL